MKMNMGKKIYVEFMKWFEKKTRNNEEHLSCYDGFIEGWIQSRKATTQEIFDIFRHNFDLDTRELALLSTFADDYNYPLLALIKHDIKRIGKVIEEKVRK